MALSNTFGFWSRLGTRERRFISVLFLVGVLGSVFISYVYLESVIKDTELEIEETRDALAELQASARNYTLSMSRKKGLEELIQKNKLLIKTAIDGVAEKTEVTTLKDDNEKKATFNKIIRYEAKTDRLNVELGETKKEGAERRNRKKQGGYIRLTQPMTFSYVAFPGILSFLNTLEAPERLMYVSKLEFNRKTGRPEFVMGSSSISTFIYEKPEEKEEEED